MATANSNLTFDQILAAVRKMSRQDKTKLWQILDAEVMDRDEIRRRARRALEQIWAANEGYTEDEVMADVNAALAEVRAETAARRT